MKTLIAFTGLSLIIILMGCIEHRPTDKTFVEPITKQLPISKLKLKGLRIYEGVIPCPDCASVYQRLSLKGDSLGVFRLVEVFRDASEDGDEVLITTGFWRHYSKKKFPNKTYLYLSEGSSSDSTRIQRYEINPKSITQLDFNGSTIDSSRYYTLKLIRKNP